MFACGMIAVSARCLSVQALGIQCLVGNEVGRGDPGLSNGPEGYPSPQNSRWSEILRFVPIPFPWPSLLNLCSDAMGCVWISFWNLVLWMLNYVSFLIRDGYFSEALIRITVWQEERTWWNCSYCIYLWQLKVFRSHKRSAGTSQLQVSTPGLWIFGKFLFHLSLIPWLLLSR